MAGTAVLFFCVVLLTSYATAESLVDAIHAISGGHSGVDLAVGVALWVVPVAAALFILVLHRHRMRTSPGWFGLGLLGPAWALSPYYRGQVLDTDLAAHIRAQTPQLHRGLEIGVCAAFRIATVSGLMFVRDRYGDGTAARGVVRHVRPPDARSAPKDRHRRARHR